jgi:hypothetical protein
VWEPALSRCHLRFLLREGYRQNYQTFDFTAFTASVLRVTLGVILAVSP